MTRFTKVSWSSLLRIAKGRSFKTFFNLSAWHVKMVMMPEPCSLPCPPSTIVQKTCSVCNGKGIATVIVVLCLRDSIFAWYWASNSSFSGFTEIIGASRPPCNIWTVYHGFDSSGYAQFVFECVLCIYAHMLNTRIDLSDHDYFTAIELGPV